MLDKRNIFEDANRNLAPAAPKHHTELFELQAQEQRLRYNSDAMTNAGLDVWSERLENIERITGTRLDDPTESFRPFSRFFDPMAPRGVGEARAEYRERFAAVNDFISKNKEKYPELSLITDEEITQASKERIRGAAEDAEAARETSFGFLDSVFAFGGTAYEAIQDPVNMLLAPLGFGGRTMLGFAVREGLASAGAEALIEPIKQETAEFAELEERTLGDAAGDIIGAGVGGFGLSLAGSGLGRALGNFFETKAPTVQVKTKELADDFTSAIHKRPLEETEIGAKITQQPFRDQAPEARVAERINDIKVKERPPAPKFSPAKDTLHVAADFDVPPPTIASRLNIDVDDTGRTTMKLKTAPRKPKRADYTSDDFFNTAEMEYKKTKLHHEEAKQFLREAHEATYVSRAAEQRHLDSYDAEYNELLDGKPLRDKNGLTKQDHIDEARAVEIETKARKMFDDIVEAEAVGEVKLRNGSVVQLDTPEGQARFNEINSELDVIERQINQLRQPKLTNTPKAATPPAEQLLSEMTDDVNVAVLDDAISRGEISRDAPVFVDGQRRTVGDLLEEIEIEEKATFELADCAGL